MRYTFGILLGSASLLAGCASMSLTPTSNMIAQSEAARELGGGEAKAPLLSILTLQESSDAGGKSDLPETGSSSDEASDNGLVIEVEAPALKQPTKRPAIDPSKIPTLEFGETPKKIPIVEIEGTTKPPVKEPIILGPSEHQTGSTMLDILKGNSNTYYDHPTFYRVADSVSDSTEWIGRRYSKLLELLNPGH